MKNAILGLTGSVTVIGEISLLAPTFPPAPGAAASGPTLPGASAEALGLENTASVCPYPRNAKHVIDGFIEAQRKIPKRPAGKPPVPAWGSGRLTVF